MSEKFNSFEKISNCGCVTYDEKIAMLVYLLDMKSIDIDKIKDLKKIQEFKEILFELYKNIRRLIRCNPNLRKELTYIVTEKENVYVTDILLKETEEEKDADVLIEKLYKMYDLIKDVIRYYSLDKRK